MRAQVAFSALLGFVLGVLVSYTGWPEYCPERKELEALIQDLERSRVGQYQWRPRAGKAPPTAQPESASQLREFLYPRNRTVLDQKNQQYKPGSQDEPVLLKDEYLYNRMVFVGVLTRQSYLSTRAKYLYDTWGKEVDELVFFVGEDCEIPADLDYLPIVKLKGIPDNVYPPVKKTFAVMQYMYDNHINQFNWFIRADDDMYVRTKRLKELLANMVPYEKVYLGRAGTGRKEDLNRLDLLPHERYCMGGPGIVLSMAALRELGPHLTNCLNAGRYGHMDRIQLASFPDPLGHIVPHPLNFIVVL